MSEPTKWTRDLLPRMPRVGWEGWFLIAIPTRKSEVHWTKTHVFRSKRRLLHTPLSAIEGLTAPGELVTYVGTGERVIESRSDLAAGGLSVGEDRFALSLQDRLDWSGPMPDYSFKRIDLRQELSISFHGKAHDRLQWIRMPGVLTYFGLHSELSGSIALNGKEEGIQGLGVLEHAWGALLPFNPVRIVRGPWHWDVLSFEKEGAEPVPLQSALAALSVPIPGRGSRGVRARGRLPGGEFQGFHSFGVKYQEFSRSEAPGGGLALKLPRRWSGTLKDRRGDLTYEAQANTPAAHAAPGGGFLGFEFEARYRAGAGKAERVFTGSGFTECGSPSWIE